MKNIGKTIRLLRIQKGWEQIKFAKKLNLSNPAVSKIETGVTIITLSRLNQIASVLNVTTVQLLAQHVLPQRNKGKANSIRYDTQLVKRRGRCRRKLAMVTGRS